ncbi:hypothetical protein IAQ67_14700 [Paenibacillus peoriae]|uniref:Peptidase M56 BlaR1 n=1 Tax=Paenibacillus peoriae TaxID=59893 RepID=A0A7H0Y255_9BACL|nr:hypothetical protein [Paenibacillus peoriae]QNR65163.1 hypothetical protein IAQ67_14700 [Paenibacillus peoriae]
MNMKKYSLTGLILALSIFVIILTVSSSNLNADSNPSTNSKSTVEVNSHNYSVNKQGQTYGHGPYPSGTQQEPDLVKAEGENGVTGYVKSSDLANSATTPEEAIASQKSIKDVGYKSIPLYDADGKTVIGEFKMYSSNGD